MCRSGVWGKVQGKKKFEFFRSSCLIATYKTKLLHETKGANIETIVKRCLIFVRILARLSFNEPWFKGSQINPS